MRFLGETELISIDARQMLDTNVSQRSIVKDIQAHRHLKNQMLASLEKNRSVTLNELRELKKQRGTEVDAVQLAVDFLTERVTQSLIQSGVAMHRQQLRTFILFVDMAVGIIHTGTSIVIPRKQDDGSEATEAFVSDDGKVTQELLRENPRGNLLIAEAVNRTMQKPSRFSPRPRPEGFIPQYIDLGADLAKDMYAKVHPLAVAIK